MMHFMAGFCISLILVSSVKPSISGMLMSERIMLMSFSFSINVKASKPLWAKKNSYSPLRIWRLKYCVNSSSRSISSSTLRILTGFMFSRSIYNFRCKFTYYFFNKQRNVTKICCDFGLILAKVPIFHVSHEYRSSNFVRLLFYIFS